jgi:hypothetical protein
MIDDVGDVDRENSEILECMGRIMKCIENSLKTSAEVSDQNWQLAWQNNSKLAVLKNWEMVRELRGGLREIDGEIKRIKNNCLIIDKTLKRIQKSGGVEVEF